MALHVSPVPAGGGGRHLQGRIRGELLHAQGAPGLAHESRTEDPRPGGDGDGDLRHASTRRMRRVLGARPSTWIAGNAVLRLRRQGLGLRAQLGWGSALPLAVSCGISEATSGIAASTGSAQTGQSIPYPSVFERYGFVTSIMIPATSGPISRPSPLVVVASPE